MMIQTKVGVPMDAVVLENYFRALINLFFKILPIWESGESSTVKREVFRAISICNKLKARYAVPSEKEVAQ